MNSINATALDNATVDGYGHVDDFNDLYYYSGAIHDRHDRFPAVDVHLSGSVAAAARLAVETYNAVGAMRWRRR